MTDGAPKPDLTVFAVRGIPDVAEGTDLADLVARHADLHDGDVLVVASKIVSKAEGRVVQPRPGESPAQTHARAVASEAVRVVAASPWVTVVETRHGFVCANAGVDASNVADGAVLLLPADPDASAQRLRDGLEEQLGVGVAVILADTFGRPWRVGQTDVALGVAGLAALRSEIGGVDRHGRALTVTEAAIADELAGIADVVRDKAAGVPVVVIRGVDPVLLDPQVVDGGRQLLRPPETDLFRRGQGGLGQALVEGAITMTAGVDPRDLWRVQATIEAVCGGSVRIRTVRARAGRGGSELAVEAPEPSIAGVAAGLLLALLSDLGYGSVLVETFETPTVWAGRASTEGSR